MKTLKYALIIFVSFIILVFIIYQFDFVKRKIVTYIHKIEIPAYATNLKIKEFRLANVLSSPKTFGIIPADKIVNFYNDIHGEQVVINSLPVGGIEAWLNTKTSNFSIIYRNFDGNLNGINVSKSSEQNIFNIEIISHYE